MQVNNAVKALDRIEMLIEYLQRELADIRGMIGRPFIDPAFSSPVAIHADENLAGSRERAEEVAQQKLGISVTDAMMQANYHAARLAESRQDPPTQQEMEEATRRASEPPEPGTAARERQAKNRALPFGGAK